MHTAASQSVFILTILCLVCCWQNPVCLNKTLEAALNFRPPSNSKRSPSSMPAWKIVNPANKDSTASPAVMRKTLAAVLEMSCPLEGSSLCMHLACLKSRAVLVLKARPLKPCLPNKIHLWGERGRTLGSPQHPSGWSTAAHRLSRCRACFCCAKRQKGACVHFPAYPSCKRVLNTLEYRACLEAPQ